MLNRLCTICTIVGLIFLFPVKQVAYAQSAIDQILVTVNSVPITESEIESRVNWIKFLVRNTAQSDLAGSVARTQAIEDAIAYQLLSQLANDAGVSVSENEVQERLSEVVSANNVSETQFLSELEAQGVSINAFTLSLYESALNDKLVQQFVIPRINVRDEEIERYLELNPNEFRPVDEFDLSVIVVSESLTMSFEQKKFVRQVVRDIDQELKRGTDFFAIASAANRLNEVQTGDLGWVQKSQLDRNLAQELSASKLNQVVGPVVSGANTFFGLVKQHRLGPSPNLPTLQEMHLSRIVLQANNAAGTEANAAQLADLRNSILAGADFAEIAKVYSHDSTTRSKGGDLGWVPEDTLPFQYLEPLSTIGVGDVSAVQQIGNIVFILHLRDIRQAGLQDRARSLARSRLRNVKLRTERANWLDELRDNAVIDFRTTF